MLYFVVNVVVFVNVVNVVVVFAINWEDPRSIFCPRYDAQSPPKLKDAISLFAVLLVQMFGDEED